MKHWILWEINVKISLMFEAAMCLIYSLSPLNRAKMSAFAIQCVWCDSQGGHQGPMQTAPIWGFVIDILGIYIRSNYSILSSQSWCLRKYNKWVWSGQDLNWLNIDNSLLSEILVIGSQTFLINKHFIHTPTSLF